MLDMKNIVKCLLIVSQLMCIIMFIELIAFRTFYSLILGASFLFILILLNVKCRSCGAELGDPRVIGTTVPVNPSIIDRCPVCGNPMIE